MGKFTMRLPHVICKPDSQHLKGCRICWLSLFLFSFHCITVSVLLCHFSWGFLTESGKAMHPLARSPSQGYRAGSSSHWAEGAQAGQERQSSCATSVGKPAAQK